MNSLEYEQINNIKYNLSILAQVDGSAQTTTYHKKSISYDYQPYSYSYYKLSILGRDKITHYSIGYSYIYTVTSNNKLIKIELEYVPTFPITVISPG